MHLELIKIVSNINSSNIILAQLSGGTGRSYILPSTSYSLQSYSLSFTAIDSKTQSSWAVPWQNFSNNLILTFTIPNSSQFISNSSNFSTGSISIQLN